MLVRNSFGLLVHHSFTVVVGGNNFLPSSQVYWNGVLRPTQFVDSTQVQVTLIFTIYPYGVYLPTVAR